MFMNVLNEGEVRSLSTVIKTRAFSVKSGGRANCYFMSSIDLLVHDRTYNSLPRGVGYVEECVEVGQKCVTYPQVMFGALHQH